MVYMFCVEQSACMPRMRIVSYIVINYFYMCTCDQWTIQNIQKKKRIKTGDGKAQSVGYSEYTTGWTTEKLWFESR
jgi:hypothetical protein